MKSVTFEVKLNTSSIEWSDVEKLYDIIDCAIKTYSGDATIKTIVE